MSIFKNTKDEYEIILSCDCTNIEHQIKICYYPDETDEHWISFCVTLVTWKSFFRRLWDGLKYAFGYKSRYGHFDEVLLYRDDIVALVEFLEGYLNASKT